jgi:perosamine synthetase
MRMTNMQAALGVAQLERLDEFVTRKRAMGKAYTQLLENVPGIRLPLIKTAYAENIYWVYGIVLDDSVDFDAAEAMKRLQSKGIGTRPFFWPMHEQPVFQRMGLFSRTHCPVASNLARRGFYIPSGMALTQDQIRESAEAVKEILR